MGCLILYHGNPIWLPKEKILNQTLHYSKQLYSIRIDTIFLELGLMNMKIKRIVRSSIADFCFDFCADLREQIEIKIGKNPVFRSILQIKIHRKNCQTTSLLA